MKKTNVYIDGFNFYYGAVKGTPYKWLNFRTLLELTFPSNQIASIKYFTARVNARPHDPDQPVRQQTYFRALATIPDLSIIFGHFLVSYPTMLKAGCPPHAPQFVQVEKTEEKGSDVNLATHFLSDGFKGLYDVALLVTNDSDLLEPLKIVRHELKKPVIILNPHKQQSVQLARHATFIRQLRRGVLAASQFPATMTDKDGTFHKPARW